MKPTLEQISNFAFEKVTSSSIKIVKGKEYNSYFIRSKYDKEVVYFVCSRYYEYTVLELCEFFNIKPTSLRFCIKRVENNNSKIDLADELFASLKSIFKEEIKITKEAYIQKLLEKFGYENKSEVRSTNDLSKLEIWLLDLLYRSNK